MTEHTAAESALPPKNPLARETAFVFTADEINQKIDADLGKRGRTMKLKGFRPGKVPLKVLRSYFGEEAAQRVLTEMAGQRFEAEMQQSQERLAVSPNVTPNTVVADGKYTVTCQYEVLPTIAAADFAGKKLKVPVFSVGEAEVAEMIEILREQRGQYVPANDAAAENDVLTIDYNTYVEGGEDNSAVDRKQAQRFVLKEQSLPPAVDTALRGAVVGDHRQAKITTPEDHPDELLRGKTLRMEIKVGKVERLEKAELDEAFFSALGVTEGGETAFKEMVKEHLEHESTVRLRNVLHRRAMERLIEATPPFDLPQSLVYNEAVGLWQRAREEQKRQGMGQYADSVRLETFIGEAQRRVALGLILAEWRTRENPEISDADIEQRLDDIAEPYEQPEQKKAQVRANSGQMESVRLSLLEDRAVDWVRASTETEEEKITLRHLLNQGGG